MEEALLLARVQFGLNISFHILFPTITIGLAWLLVVFRLRYERTRDPAWLGTYKLWVKVFALTFAMGVVSGITMSFQFGTNWPGYMNKVGNVAGPLLAYEVLTAFFLEATFLGVMLFGMNKVSGRVHVASTIIVAAGTTLSAFWILALNSWMQTPTGHVIENGVLIAGSWLAVIFNPSFPYRLTHMLLASGITASFLVAGLSAWRLLKAPQDPSAQKTLRFGVHIAAVLVPLQIFVGDLHGLNTLKHQPAKIAALSAVEDRERRCAYPGGNPEREGKAHRLRGDDPEGRGADPRARRRRRTEGPRRFQGSPAGRAGVLGVPRDGRHGHAHARAFLAGDLRAEKAPAALAALGVRRLHLLRLGGDARGLAGDRDRPPAVAGHRDLEDGGCRG